MIAWLTLALCFAVRRPQVTITRKTMIFHALSVAFLWLLPITYAQPHHFPEQFSDSTLDFAIDMLKVLSKSTANNVLFSPGNINALLGVLQQGAHNETARQLEQVLHANAHVSKIGHAQLKTARVSSNEVTQTFDSGEIFGEEAEGTVKLEVAARMYLRPEIIVNEEFRRIADEYFDLQVVPLNVGDPEAVNCINEWVYNKTGGHIEELFPQNALTPDTAVVLASAVFFSGKWLEPFSEIRPAARFFTSEKFMVRTPQMMAVRRIRGDKDMKLGFKWIELPYKGDVFSMFLILPNADHKLDEVVPKLSSNVLRGMIESNSYKFVNLKIPKFSLNVDTPAEEALIQLGLTDLFTDASDLSGISPALKVSTLLHKSFLNVDEEGSQAAAATGLVINTLSLSWRPDNMDFHANQPFLVFIIDKFRMMPLFVGKVRNPLENKKGGIPRVSDTPKYNKNRG